MQAQSVSISSTPLTSIDLTQATNVEVKATTGQKADLSFRGTYTSLPEGAATGFGY